MAIQTLYQNFKVTNKTEAVNLWTEYLKDLSYEQVSMALKEFSLTDTKGFAPTIGQLRERALRNPEEMTDAQAWGMVYAALCNGIYGAETEYNKLPELIKRAVGSPDALRAWAKMDEESITVAESTFKRSYRAIAEKAEVYNRLPLGMRPQIEAAPMIQIEDHAERYEPGDADPDVVAEMLAKLNKKWEGEMV